MSSTALSHGRAVLQVPWQLLPFGAAWMWGIFTASQGSGDCLRGGSIWFYGTLIDSGVQRASSLQQAMGAASN